jgi:hypothetical protein
VGQVPCFRRPNLQDHKGWLHLRELERARELGKVAHIYNLALRRQRFEASLDYIVKPCIKKPSAELVEWFKQ